MHQDDDSTGKDAKVNKGVIIDGVRASFVQRRMCDLYVEKHGAGSNAGEEAWSACYRQAVKDWEKQNDGA